MQSEIDELRAALAQTEQPAQGERVLQEEPEKPINQVLLDALNSMLTHMGMDEDEWNKPTFDQARQAIALAQAQSAKLEPLSVERINRLWDDSFIGADPTSGNQRFKFARAIEAEITKGQ